MKNSSADKLRQVPPGYLIMRIDPHKKIHVAVAMTQDTIIHTKFKFVNSRQGYEDVIKEVKDQMAKTGSRGVIFAIETGGHYWRNLAYFLDEQGAPFRIINPFTLRRIREGKDINRRKNGFHDAEMAAELLGNGEFVDTKLPRAYRLNFMPHTAPIVALSRRGPGLRTCLRACLMAFSQNLTRSSRISAV